MDNSTLVAMQTAIDSLLSKVTSLENEKSAGSSKIAALEAKIASLDSKGGSSGSNDGALEAVAARVEKLEQAGTKQKAAVDSLDSTVTAMMADADVVASLKTRVTSVEVSTTDLRAKVDSAAAKAEESMSKASAAGPAPDASKITVLESKVVDLELSVQTMEREKLESGGEAAKATVPAELKSQIMVIERKLGQFSVQLEAVSKAKAAALHVAPSTPSSIARTTTPTKTKGSIEPTLKKNIGSFFDAWDRAGQLGVPPKPNSFMKSTILQQKFTPERVTQLLELADVLDRLDPERDDGLGAEAVQEIFNGMSAGVAAGGVTLKVFLETAVAGRRAEVASGTTWDDPRNTASSMGTNRTFPASTPRRASVALGGQRDRETLNIQNLLRKLYERAERTNGEQRGAYVTPERTFTESQMAFMISEADVQAALGKLATFDTSKGAKKSIPEIFSQLNVDSEGKIAVRPFITICDPLVMVKATLEDSSAAQSVEGDVRTAATISSGTITKLQSMFDDAAAKGSACEVTEASVKKFTSGEKQMRVSAEGFADLIRSATDYDAIVTPSDGALEIDSLFEKLNMNGDDHVSFAEFLSMITPQAAMAKKKSGRKRFNTWGRKKKAKSIDAHLGVGIGDGESGGIAAKRAVFGGDVLF